MTPKLKHWFYDNYILVSFILLIVVFGLWVSIDALRTWSFLSPAVGSVLALTYFVLKQHLEEIRLFTELFSTFNKRYDDMNERLNTLCAAPSDQPLKAEEIAFLYDYFNLCAEEYLYYRKGFIYPEVWSAWCNGMRIFYDNPRIRALWEKECQTDSYYGFTTACLEAAAQRKPTVRASQRTPLNW